MFFDLKKIIDHIQRIWESINTWHVLLWIHFLVVTVIIVIYYWNAILLNYHKKIRWWLINHAMFACDQSLCRRVVQCAVCWNGRGNVWHSSSKMSTNCVSVNNTFTSLITGKTVSQCLVNISLVSCAFSALALLVGHQEEHPTCKNWVMRCWFGYLSGVRWRLFTYGPADATAIPEPHHLLPPLNETNQTTFTFLVPAYPGCPGKEAESGYSIFALAAKFHLEPHDVVRSSITCIKDSFWFYFSKLVQSLLYLFVSFRVCYCVCVFYFCSCCIRAY